jgi:predicted Zn-dependent peptidase
LEEEFKAEFGNVQEEMVSRANNHFRHLSLEMRRALGLIVRTDAERLKLMENVHVEDIRAHYRRTHTSHNLRFIIAGNINQKRRLQIEQLLNAIELPTNGSRFELPKEMPKPLPKAVYVPNSTVENLYFYIDTFAHRRLDDPESDALNLMNTMLTETLYSRILGTARERGLVYGMSSGLSQTRDVSNWWLGAQVSSKNSRALFKIIVDELAKVMSGDIDDAEIEATKLYALGRFQRSAQTVGGTASGYSGRYFFDGVVENYFQIPERIRAVSKQQIVDAARSVFADELWGFGVLGDCGREFSEGLREQIAPLWQAA